MSEFICTGHYQGYNVDLDASIWPFCFLVVASGCFFQARGFLTYCFGSFFNLRTYFEQFSLSFQKQTVIVYCNSFVQLDSLVLSIWFKTPA